MKQIALRMLWIFKPAPGGGSSRTHRATSILIVMMICLDAPAFGFAQDLEDGTDPPRNSISSILERPSLEYASLGLHVVDCDSLEILYTSQSDKLFTPASNTKLFTGACVLDRLGGEYRIQTTLFATSLPDGDGVLDGDLVVYGRGDPSFSAQFNQGRHDQALWRLIKVVQEAGIRSVQGGVIGMDHFFKGPLLGRGWGWDDLEFYYGAGCGALSVVENVIDIRITPAESVGSMAKIEYLPETQLMHWDSRVLTVGLESIQSVVVERMPWSDVTAIQGAIRLGADPIWESVTVPNPSEFFMEQLKASLVHSGIQVTGGASVLPKEKKEELKTSELPIIGVTQSPPLTELLSMMMKRSQNMMAHQLLMHAGERGRLPGNETKSSESLGTDLLNGFMNKVGIHPHSYYFEEGSGLSRANKVSPASVVQLLLWIRKQPYYPEFYQSLPIAGKDGTLKRRFTETPLESNLRAKTGTLTHVHALSGYLTTASGREVAFSLLLNNFMAGSSTEARKLMDELLLALHLTL